MNNVKKFQCINCGECCRDFTSDSTKGHNGKQFVDELQFLLNKKYLMLKDWEVDIFRERLSNVNSDRKVIPANLLFDLKNNRSIILDYTLDGQSCPFFERNRCAVYEDRPIVCKQFPCIQDLNFLFSREPMNLSRNLLCGFEKEDEFPHNLKNLKLRPKDVFEIFENRYGNSFYYNLAGRLVNMTVASFVASLENKGKIKVARQGYNLNFLYKRIGLSDSIDISELYKNETGSKLEDNFNIDTIKAFLKSKID